MPLDDNTQKSVNQIANNFLTTNVKLAEQLTKSNISQELISNTLPLVTKAAASALSEVPKLTDIYTQVRQYQDFTKLINSSKATAEEQEFLKLEQQAVMSNMLTKGADILNNKELQGFLNTNLSSYLKNNKESIVQVITNVAEQNEW